jgi:hypothetical protein
MTVETGHANTQEYILESFGLAVGAEMAVHAKGIKNEVPQLREYTVTIKDDGVLPADTQKFLIDPLSNAQPTQFDATAFEVYQHTRLNAKKRKMAEAANKENQGLNVKQTFFQQKTLPSSPSFKKLAVALVARDEPSEFKGTFFKKEVATLPFVACSNSSPSLSIAQILSVPPRVDTCDFVV